MVSIIWTIKRKFGDYYLSSSYLTFVFVIRIVIVLLLHLHVNTFQAFVCNNVAELNIHTSTYDDNVDDVVNINRDLQRFKGIIIIITCMYVLKTHVSSSSSSSPMYVNNIWLLLFHTQTAMRQNISSNWSLYLLFHLYVKIYPSLSHIYYTHHIISN